MNTKAKNNLFAKLAFYQAEINLGSTGKNPSVGCVVEQNGSIISSGQTSLNGRPHAEYNALKKKKRFNNSNIFVTLEPCSHYGVTPPCTKIIIKKKIKKVYFPIYDIDERTSKKSKRIFKRNKIDLNTGLLNSYAKKFYESYHLNKKKKIPLIDAKIAISKDYFSINKKNKWISNNHSLKRGHLIRSRYDCILSTSKTINTDNSKLDCRIEGLENKSPDIIIIDRKLKLKRSTKISEIKKRKIILFTQTNNKKKENYLKKKNIRIVKISKMNNKLDFLNIFRRLNSLGYTRILVESGLIFLKFLHKNKIINNLYIFKSSYKLKKKGKNNCKSFFIKNIKNEKIIKVNLFGDKLLKKSFKNV